MRLLKLLIVLISLSSLVHGQSKKVFQNQTMKYSELAKILNPPKWDTLIFERVTFKSDLGKRNWDDSVYGEFIVSNPIKIGRTKAIKFTECNFSSSIFFEGGFIDALSMKNCIGPDELIFQYCDIQALWLDKPAFESVHIEHSTFKDLVIDAENERATIILYKITIDTGFVELTGNHLHIEKSNFFLKEQSVISNEGKIDDAWTSVQSTKFDQLDSGYTQFEQRNGYIQILNCTFFKDVDLYGDGESVTWNIVDNIFKKEVGFRSLAEIGPASYVDFKEIYKDKSLGWHIEKDGKTIFYDGSGDQIAEDRHYTNLLRLHKRLHNFYIAGGNIRSANQLYIMMKDIETSHMIYEFEKSASFDLRVRIGLNRILRFYTRYSTDPSRAIVISLWVVFGFGIFYIFFPSSWDLSSKSKLIGDFKNLKNIQTGRYKKITEIFINLILIFLNAFTLSLNSFVTLGFGEIPTKGFARYMTIGEGFLGWFLLTLFSVALISQSNF